MSGKGYFISEDAELIFYLLELDGKQRMDKLDITGFHYHSKSYAEQWRNKLADILIVSNHSKVVEGMNELEKLYKSMIITNSTNE